MKVLQDILYKVNIKSVLGPLDIEVAGLCIDSRNVAADNVFFALKGVGFDGHQFIPNAIASGASVIICQVMPENIQDNVTYVEVADTAAAAGIMASNFFDNPSEKLKLVGVTGTNGKTTITTVLFKLFRDLGYNVGLLSTVHNCINEDIFPATHTTPDPVNLNRLLSEMVRRGCSHVFMEVSSHAIHQHRITGLKFTGAIFSNITHDHLDYHNTFDEYIRVKKSFFDSLHTTAFAISNLDDKRGTVMLQNTAATKYFYSLRTPADFKGKILENNLSGLVMNINEKEVHLRLIGTFNAYNILAIYGAAIQLGEDENEVMRIMSNLTSAEGRFDYQVSEKLDVIGIVDYSHTPDALHNVLTTIKELKKGHENVITVVGCGGDRDRTKRSVMASVAAEYSDKVILTSDNPRTENPVEIIREMEDGLNSAGKRKSLSIADRKEAIKTAVSFAQKDDIILVAGKGHEKYQEINGVKHPFDDKEVLAEMFRLLEK